VNDERQKGRTMTPRTPLTNDVYQRKDPSWPNNIPPSNVKTSPSTKPAA
jgi:hypothetical protein